MLLFVGWILQNAKRVRFCIIYSGLFLFRMAASGEALGPLQRNSEKLQQTSRPNKRHGGGLKLMRLR